MSLDDLKATLDRSFADRMWSRDGMITPEAWKTGKKVVLAAGILKKPVPPTTTSSTCSSSGAAANAPAIDRT